MAAYQHPWADFIVQGTCCVNLGKVESAKLLTQAVQWHWQTSPRWSPTYHVTTLTTMQEAFCGKWRGSEEME